MRSAQRGLEFSTICQRCEWIHIPHLSKRGTAKTAIDRCLAPIKTESVSESVDKITGGCLRLQLFFMPPKKQKIAPRKPRTDAQRNRERILEVAKEAFTQSGANASLDDIAKEAGVGAGTLYRHFPTRDALIEAVYRTEVEKLAAAEREVLRRHAAGRCVASLDALVRRLHRSQADHRARAEHAGRRAFEAV